jgi:RNA 2',3'-cyclic 3'-phosphodiesterase
MTQTAMRTFIAIELPLPSRDHLVTVQRQVQGELRRRGISDCFNWVAPEKAHLTLRFLGETSAQQVAALQHSLAQLLPTQSSFGLTIQAGGAFPHFRRPNVLWLGLGGEVAPLQAMQQQIEVLVRQQGFAPEERRFTPHLTLARAQRQATAAHLAAAGQAIQRTLMSDQAAPQFFVAQVVHMQSELRPEGARYTPLCTFSLQRRAERTQ